MKKQKSGLTLIEILIYTTLLTIVLGLITNFLYQVINFKVLNQMDSDLFQNSSLIMGKIGQDVRKTQEITNPSDDNFVNTLVLQTEAGQITYLVDEGVLKRNNVGLTDERVRVDIEPPNRGFRKIDNSVQVRVGLEAKLKPFGKSTKKNDYQTTVFIGD